MLNWVGFLLLGLFWGGSFLAIEYTVKLFPPFLAAALRISVAGVLLAFWALANGKRVGGPKGTRSKLFWLGFIALGVPWGCLFWGEQYVAPAVASIINSTVPIFVFLFSWLLLQNERPNQNELLGVMLGFGGILFVFLPAIEIIGVNPMLLAGMVAILTMATSYGLSTTIVRGLGSGIDASWSFFYQSIGASAMLFAMSFFLEDHNTPWTQLFYSKSALSLLYLAIFSTAIAWVIYFKLIHVWGPVRAASVTYIVPMVSILFDWLIEGRIPKMSQLIGGGLILLGLIIMRKKRIILGGINMPKKLAA